ncbi:MAG: hypothetical protein GWP08_19060 [Nitrospiraceae bacterium]|nr:hypothetical protein [Nitrospiraceae bacterium]
MPLYKLIVISLMVGLVAAGLVWFLIEFVQNVLVAVRVAAEKKVLRAQQEEERKRQELEDQVRDEREGGGVA